MSTSNQSKDQIAEDFKKTILLLDELIVRQKTFAEELNFFTSRWPIVCVQPPNAVIYGSALRRLSNECMFLIIDTWSIYEGITKKQSLYTKTIKNNSAQLSKFDKTHHIDESNFTHLGYFNGDNRRDATPDEVNKEIRRANEEQVAARRNLRDSSGLKSKSHDDADKWVKSLLDPEEKKKLSKYRDSFAHRYDNLSKISDIRVGFLPLNPEEIQEILDFILDILKKLRERLGEILVYHDSLFLYKMSLYYDSLARLKQID
jgi:hypothetical protein